MGVFNLCPDELGITSICHCLYTGDKGLLLRANFYETGKTVSIKQYLGKYTVGNTMQKTCSNVQKLCVCVSLVVVSGG